MTEPRIWPPRKMPPKSGIEYNFFYYPPPFLLICAALARLPYLAAFLVFEAGTLGLYLLAASRIIRRLGPSAFILLLAFPPLLWTIGLGQNALLTAALFATATLLVDRRPSIAGVFFGALCYKPHFALLVPVALAAGRCWPAFVTACLTVTALCLLSLALFGWQTWHDYILAAANSDTVYASGTNFIHRLYKSVWRRAAVRRQRKPWICSASRLDARRRCSSGICVATKASPADQGGNSGFGKSDRSPFGTLSTS